MYRPHIISVGIVNERGDKMNSIFRIVYISVSVLLIAAPTYAEGGGNRPSGDHGIKVGS